ncbi:MAG: hypothetical protein CVU01_00340 [Bacteroidetes bacterium HGW-Bacteroidetes-18]|nr:MAG: hypothetical protein CVU01_00340 [Bacteroidetes bacterium HGW-Bacteroidetes-18]
MEVFVPHQKDRNIYLDEIISFSNHNFIFGNYKEYRDLYKIVNIQFPEAIFDWKSPSTEELVNFELQLLNWKKKSKIVYTMNDFTTHYDKKNKFSEVFSLIHKYSDGVIHLGKYSLDNYEKYFSSSCLHTIIYHPLYNSLTEDYMTKEIQSLVPTDLTNKFIVSAIGGIRSKEELDLILKIFKKLPIKNKFLIVPRMFQFIIIPDYIPYRFRKYYKRLIEKKYCFSLSKNQYFFSARFLEYSYLVDLVKRSSLMIIPRIKNLNSGNLYLGLTFDKLMIIPEIGNLTETANYFGLPLLDLQNKNYKEVITMVLDLKSNQYYSSDKYLKDKHFFHPEKIAKDYDAFFNLLGEFK